MHSFIFCVVCSVTGSSRHVFGLNSDPNNVQSPTLTSTALGLSADVNSGCQTAKQAGAIFDQGFVPINITEKLCTLTWQVPIHPPGQGIFYRCGFIPHMIGSIGNTYIHTFVSYVSKTVTYIDDVDLLHVHYFVCVRV